VVAHSKNKRTEGVEMADTVMRTVMGILAGFLLMMLVVMMAVAFGYMG
jgi:hypothetical protein